MYDPYLLMDHHRLVFSALLSSAGGDLLDKILPSNPLIQQGFGRVHPLGFLGQPLHLLDDLGNGAASFSTPRIRDDTETAPHVTALHD